MKWRRCRSSRTDLPPPSPRSGHVAVAVKSEQWATEFVVVCGGLSDSKQFLKDVVVLETGEEHWMRPVSEGDVCPGPRAFHAGCAIGSRVYIFGGSWSPRNRYQADVWCLDTDDWHWSLLETSDQPSPRDFPTMVHIGGSLIVLYGGYSGSKFMADVHVLDVTTGAWKEVQPEGFGSQQPAPRSGHAATVVAQRLAVFGGETTSNAMLADLWTLRGLQGDGPLRWTKLTFKGQAPTARGAHAMADMGTKLVVFGGHGEEGFLQRRSVYYGDVHVLDREPESGPMWFKFDVGTEGPQGRAYHTFTTTQGKRALLFGGCNATHRATFGDAWWLILEGSPFWNDPTEEPRSAQSGALVEEPMVEALSSSVSGEIASPPQAAPFPEANRVSTSSTVDDRTSVSPDQVPRGPQTVREALANSYQPASGAAVNSQTTSATFSPLAMQWSEAQQVEKAAANAQALEELRSALGLPSQSRARAQPSTATNHALLALGRRELARQIGSSPSSSAQKECLRVARQYLSRAIPSDLKLGDIDALLGDYKSLAVVGLSACTSRSSDLFRSFASASPLPGRYMHLVPSEVRMCDIPSLLDDYRYLLAVSASRTG